jgi:hypothetical protein
MLKMANVSNHNFTKIDAKNHKTKIGNDLGRSLLGLLIISPCSVQNILQNDFSVKQQKTLNRSKSTIQTILIVAFNMTSKLIKENSLKIF